VPATVLPAATSLTTAAMISIRTFMAISALITIPISITVHVPIDVAIVGIIVLIATSPSISISIPYRKKEGEKTRIWAVVRIFFIIGVVIDRISAASGIPGLAGSRRRATGICKQRPYRADHHKTYLYKLFHSTPTAPLNTYFYYKNRKELCKYIILKIK
jgi:uncharacterized membrane protein